MMKGSADIVLFYIIFYIQVRAQIEKLKKNLCYECLNRSVAERTNLFESFKPSLPGSSLQGLRLDPAPPLSSHLRRIEWALDGTPS